MSGFRLFEKVRLVSSIAGVGLLFLGERYFSAGASRFWLGSFSFALMCVGVFFAGYNYWSSLRRNFYREAVSWKLCLIWQSTMLFSCLIYVLYLYILGDRAQPTSFLEKALLASWLVFGSLSIFMGVGTEWAQLFNGRDDYAEPQRVQLAAKSWLKVGILTVIVSSLNFVAVRKNTGWDLSYLKTSRPSSSTQQLLGMLQQPVDVALFFPVGNEVLSKARLYFDELKNASPRLNVQFFDMETNPVEAEDFKVSRNGFIVLRSQGLVERFDLGLNLDSARKGLKNLDIEFQNALTAVTQKKKTLYFTRGHGELSWVADDKDGDGLNTIKKLEDYLRSAGYILRFFGLSDGAATGVPADADAVVVIGGTQPFLADEARVIKDYVESGGRLIFLLDVDLSTETALSKGARDASKDPLVRWLRDLGADFKPEILANESNYVKELGSLADRWFLFSNVFTSHASVQTLARNDQRAAVIVRKSGFFETNEINPKWSVFDAVRSLSDTFVDLNKDFRLNEKSETRGPRVLGVALEQKSHQNSESTRGRVVAFADANVVSDALIENPANLVYFVDSLRWLSGQPSAVMGLAASEEDVPIRHSQREDIVWFYGTIGLVPALVLVAGRFATLRARRPRKTAAKREVSK